MIGEGDWKQVLVFTRTKHGANHLAEQLNKDGITAAAIHGNKSRRPYPCAGRLQRRPHPRAGGDRHRGARPGYRPAAARGELRAA